jgi:hypothetical protein
MLPKGRVLLNAVHTSGGGGLVYLQGILPQLAQEEKLEWHLLIPQAGLDQLKVPKGIKVHVAPTLPFGVNHVWEQLAIPVLARVWGCKATLSNANYGPLFAPRAGVIVHTTTRAGCAWRGLYLLGRCACLNGGVLMAQRAPCLRGAFGRGGIYQR